MKLRVITDVDGFVLGTAPISIKPTGRGAPTVVRLLPMEGQSTVDIEVHEDIAKLHPQELHRRYRVNLSGTPRLETIEIVSDQTPQRRRRR
jgi:hypothetical protein